ncbi:hypothetical protein N7450_001150 [Penicillium hetheringtonii]|uniref:Hydrophobin n=1 Tax=Penicillium hetheringtonii TaxID=911720 RepID=A0AAD6E3G1_9EURO|nr:hypothetical protein N7450_001150 [Penicillium hetheringtonii]
MKLLALFALTAIASAEFACIHPVNPIPAGPPGVCCEDLDQSALLDFVYTGKACTQANKVDEADDGKTTYSLCQDGKRAACCDPLLTKWSEASNPACVLPEKN